MSPRQTIFFVNFIIIIHFYKSNKKMGEKRLASSPPLKPSKREVSRNKLLLGMAHLSRLERESQSNLSTLVDGLGVNFSRDCEEGLG